MIAGFFSLCFTAIAVAMYVALIYWISYWAMYLSLKAARAAGRATIKGFEKTRAYIRSKKQCGPVEWFDDSLFSGNCYQGEVLWKS